MAESVKQRLGELVGALLGISTFAPSTAQGIALDDATTRSVREVYGGMLEAIPQIRLRWYPPDVERAQRLATNGDMTMVGQLSESMRIDGVIRGLGDARTSVVKFPKRFYGSAEVIDVLQSKTNSDRNVYDELIPATEAALMAWDGITTGVAIGEMMPVRGRNFPVLVRRFPQNLRFRWWQNQWYYQSVVGLIPINPGVPDEHGNSWVFHIPGGRLAPWNNGLWNTLGRSYINKTQTIFARQSYEMKHSHPARVAIAALGATEEERQGFLGGVIRWAMNAAFALPVGWDLKLIESNGQGIAVYEKSIETYNAEIATALCGSAVMLQGTVGFSNVDVFRVVQKDLIETTARGWDHTVNTQILPAFIGQRWGVDALDNATTVETDTTAPADRKVEADTMLALGNSVKGLVEAIRASQIAAGVDKPIALNVVEILARFGIPTLPGSVRTAKALEESKADPEGDSGGGGGANNEPKEPPPTKARIKAGGFNEGDHPRADDGKFGEGAGDSKGEAPAAPKTHADYKEATTQATSYLKADKARVSRVQDYTQDGFEDLNKYLNLSPQDREKTFGGKKADALQLKAARLAKDLEGSPKFEGEVHRGTYLPAAVFEKIQKDGKTYSRSFWSTTTDSATAEGFANNRPGGKSKSKDVQAILHIKQNAGVAISGVSKEQLDEKEILIKPGVIFKVSKIEAKSGVKHIYLEQAA
jgi:hypothetical protein